MISDWEVDAEPAQPATFTITAYAADLQFLSSLTGPVFVTPDGTEMYRMLIDSDGAADTEFLAPYSGAIPATQPPITPPFPVFGQVDGDLLILSPGSGIIFPNGFGNVSPRRWSRLFVDNDGALATEPFDLSFWIQIPEVSIASAVDAFGNWVFTSDLMIGTPGQGLVLPVRGGLTTRRVRLDFDGAIVSE